MSDDAKPPLAGSIQFDHRPTGQAIRYGDRDLAFDFWETPDVSDIEVIETMFGNFVREVFSDERLHKAVVQIKIVDEVEN